MRREAALHSMGCLVGICVGIPAVRGFVEEIEIIDCS